MTSRTPAQPDPPPLTVSQRREQVAELLLAEQPYARIADMLGVSKSTIGEDAIAIREEWKTAAWSSLEEHRNHTRAQLLRLYRAVAPRAHQGHLPSVETARRLLQDIRKLDGLDRPEEVHVRGQIGVGLDGDMGEALLAVAKQHAAGLVPAGREHVGEIVDG